MSEYKEWRREFFRAGGYFFATVIETVDEDKFYLRIRLDSGKEMYAVPSMGHMKAIDSEQFERYKELGW